MKNKLTLKLGLGAALLVFAFLCVYVGAQQPGSARNDAATAADTLQSAVLLLDFGDPQDATNLISSIPQDSPEYPAGRCYNALSLFHLGDYKGFLKEMESPVAQSARVTSVVREELDYDQIHALFYFRRFDDLLPRIQAFKTVHRASTRAPVLSEFQMAALFERGMKKLEEVSRTQDTNEVSLHRTDARATLNQFLSLSGTLNRTNYGAITNRNLKEDCWRARIMLGDDTAAYNEIAPANTADQEKFSLLRLQLSARLQPLDWDHNFQLRTNFLNQFPNSKNRKRVEFDTVDVSFPIGKKLLAEADAAQNTGNAGAAGAKRAAAHQYFQVQRSLMTGLTAGKDAGFEDWDLFELQEDLLYGYYLEKDFNALSTLSSSVLAQSKTGDSRWVLGKFFAGVVKLNQSPVDMKGAAADFDDIIAVGFNDKADNDHRVISAIKWRVRIALSAGDKQKAYDLVQLVKAGNCRKNIKTDFLSEYSGLVGLQ